MVKPLILVINDDVMTCNFLKIVLERSGYSVAVTYDGDDGIAAAKTLKPAVVICDYIMPSKCGAEVARELRADPSVAHTPFMLCATLLLSDINALLHLVDDFLMMPFQVRDLIDRVGRLAQAYREPFVRDTLLIIHGHSGGPAALEPLLTRLRAVPVGPVAVLPSRLDGSGINRDIAEAVRASRLLIVCVTQELLEWPYTQFAYQYFAWHGKPLLCLMCEEVELPDELAVAHLYEADELDALVDAAAAACR